MNELPALSHLLLSGGSFPGIASFLTCMHYAAKSPGVTSEISEYSLSVSVHLSLSLSLSFSPYSLSLQNSTIPLTSANSEISLLNLVIPPGSVWVSLPVLWPGTSSQAGRGTLTKMTLFISLSGSHCPTLPGVQCLINIVSSILTCFLVF